MGARGAGGARRGPASPSLPRKLPPSYSFSTWPEVNRPDRNTNLQRQQSKSSNYEIRKCNFDWDDSTLFKTRNICKCQTWIWAIIFKSPLILPFNISAIDPGTFLLNLFVFALNLPKAKAVNKILNKWIGTNFLILLCPLCVLGLGKLLMVRTLCAVLSCAVQQQTTTKKLGLYWHWKFGARSGEALG